ncbi:MAG: pyruvate formate lyase family protein [Candidatus Latescibacterota bacterium]
MATSTTRVTHLRQFAATGAPDAGAPLAQPFESVWSEAFHEAWMAGEGLDYRLRFARAQAADLAAVCPVVRPEELILGGDRRRSIVTQRPPGGTGSVTVDTRLAEELKERHPDQAGRIDGIVAYWQGWLAQNPDRIGLTCHTSLAYERVVELGIDGLRRYVQEWRDRNAPLRPDCGPWYEGLLVVLEGLSDFIAAHAVAARAAAARLGDPQQRAEMERVASACQHVVSGAPRSFHEAVQLFYLVFCACGHDSPGPVDRYLYPPLRRDLERGALTLDQAQEIVDCLWCKFAERTAYGATLAGQLRDGTDATNELSFLCLSAIRRLRLLSPRTAVRWHPGISPALWTQAVDTVASGAAFPSLVNDEAIVAAAVGRGMRMEDAREYTFVGCGQTFPHGRGHGSYEDVVVNAPHALELALRGGVDPTTGERLGPATGAPDQLTTFEAFLQAWRTQIDHLVGQQIERVNQRRTATAGRACDHLRSLLTFSCVERGLDWHEGGAQYSEGMVDLVGLTTVTDALVAVKQGVYERGLVSLPQLVAILDRNWEDEEPLRQCFLRRLPKFGNGDPLADDIAATEVARLIDFVGSHRTCFGGPWGVDIIGWSGAVIYGERTSATPDGRRAGEPLADCAGPAQGRNTEGLTQTLQSVLRLPHARAHGPLALSLRFPRAALADAASRAKLRAAVEAYFAGGGQHLQICVAGAEEMRAAQRDPEAHRDLVVRVGGFNAYFATLDRRWQDDLIARSEMGLG